MALDLRTAYSCSAFDDPDKLVSRAEEALAGIDFDTMVCTGTSGTSVVPFLARWMGKHFAIVRKASEKSHDYGRRVNGMLGERWIFVDDFCGSGSTLRSVHQAIEDVLASRGSVWDDPPTSEYVGAYLYERDREVVPYQYGEDPVTGYQIEVQTGEYRQGKFTLPGHEAHYENCYVGSTAKCLTALNNWTGARDRADAAYLAAGA